MLRKLGVDQHMINKALFSQMGLFFIFPLALAIVHSVFGMMVSTKILDTMGAYDIAGAIGITAAIVVIIAGALPAHILRLSTRADPLQNALLCQFFQRAFNRACTKARAGLCGLLFCKGPSRVIISASIFLRRRSLAAC